jgi:dihydrofolate synthase/folylpolyglutamate synthase
LRPTQEAISRGLATVDWAGRWERLHLGGRRLILDASHNPEGAETLATNLKALVEATGRKPVVITGALGVSRAGPLLAVVSAYAKEIHLAVPNQSRACSFEELEALIPDSYEGRVVRNRVESMFPSAGICSVGGFDDIVVLTGSIYLLGEALARLQPERGAGEGRLQDF